MSDSILLGLSRFMIPVPRRLWRGQVPRKARHLTTDLRFMSAEHHRVRNYAVRELPRAGKPLPPETIAQSVNLPVARVKAILDDLEEHRTYLFRNEQGAVSWAYPVTVERTPHHVRLSSGEEAYAP